MKQHLYFKMKLWIIDLAIAMALTFVAGKWIFSESIIKNILGWLMLGTILYLVRKAVRIYKAIKTIEHILENNK